ncbi:MAG TPA: mandelate racemase/muconate lactonizing enzyme family protein [Nitrospiraceae bacterium]|jgi:L-alanine-DL-glutamate epimerase-like enolase superfamily enzyme|nr:mandelate racemase/muconate lactonizing enzyme family protein [Nitrospiraceae bacterium]
MSKNPQKINRRDLLKTSALGLGSSFLFTEAAEAYPRGVNTNSRPSDLKITDLRVATIVKPGPSPCSIIRIDTNQGVYGLGEVRDGASPTYALFLKSRILGENPLQIDKIFRKIKQFGGHARQAGGVCSIEMALWDVAGKVYTAPVYAMLGGKHRDKIRIYADTTESDEPKVYAQRMKERKEKMGITWLKMDLGVERVTRTPGTVTGAAELNQWEASSTPHPLLAMEITDKGIAMLEEYVAAVRDAVGMEIPLSLDHLGHLGVKSIIRLGKAYEKYNLSWMEDVIPWQYTELLKEISDQSPTPILTGEDIYLKEDFAVLCQRHAVGKIHPDLATSGGILETHKIGDMAWEYGVPMAMHYAGTPIGCMASVHCAAATLNFLALENHSLDVPWWSSIVQGVESPIVNHGWIAVPDGPGLGITLNDDVVRQHLAPGTGYFEPTTQWDHEHSWDRLWS